MTFGPGGYGTTGKEAVLAPSTVWMFAEGSTEHDYETFFTILNPSDQQAATVTASFFDERGVPLGNRTIVIEPLHRGNIKLNEIFPRGVRVATLLSSSVPVVAERPLYFGPPNSVGASSTQFGRSSPASGSDVFGRNGGGVRWTFAGGNTAPGFDEFVLLFNPNLTRADVSAVFYTPDGKTVRQSYSLEPMSRETIYVNSIDGLPRGHHGIVLTTTNGRAFIAEQTLLYRGISAASSTQGIAD
jgi:hypothetical protein